MNYGMYISASGALTSLYRQDVFTNNLANATTPGFKPSLATARQRDPVRAEDALGYLPSSDLLEQLGAGVMMSPTQISFKQGPINGTANDLDVAIRGDGFFVVRHESGEEGDTLRLTRDGRWTRNDDGALVRVTDGKAILDDRQRPIRLPDEGKITIDQLGTIHIDGVPIARVALLDAEDKSQILPAGDGLFEATSSVQGNLQQATGHILQRAIEDSAINPIDAMMQMTAASKAAQSNIGMITYHDRLMERAINGLGRVA